MGPEIRASAATALRRPSLASRRAAPAARGLHLAVAVAVLGLPACALNQEGVQPPRNEIFFPGGALVDASGSFLYVTNSNSDLRYNNGTLVVVDLAKAKEDYAKQNADGTSFWSSCPGVNYIRPADAPAATPLCCWDFLDPLALNCDSRSYVDPDASIRLGSFAGAMVFKSGAGCETGAPRSCGQLYVAVRGNTSITVVDSAVDSEVDGDKLRLSCRDAAATFGECDEDHRITVRTGPHEPVPTTDAAKINLPEEPYALAMNAAPETQLLVGHLRGGAVSLIDVSQASRTVFPKLIGFYGAIVPPDGSGQRGITSLLLRTTKTKDGPNEGHFYAGSRYVPRVMGVVTTGNGVPAGPAVLDNVAVIDSGEQYVSSLAGSETRGIQFIEPIGDAPVAPGARPKDRAFVLQRVPPALLSFDSDNMNNQAPVDILETCNSPTFLDKHGEGVNLRLYVTCFEDGEVYVFDPRVPRLVDIVEVGRGPAGLAFAPEDSPDADRRAYVVGFGANNISVIDIEAGSPTENHVIQRIGFPSPVPR